MGLIDSKGYLSFWNDNISYALRGCIVIELAFRGRVSMQKDSSRRRFPLQDRVIEVIDDTLTGEVLLDEALKMMKSSEKMSVASWIDLMSGMYFPNKYCIAQTRELMMDDCRRNLEPHENRLPVKTSAGTTSKGFGRQRNPSNRKAKLPPLRHGNPPCGRRRCKGRDPSSRPNSSHVANRRSAGLTILT